MGIQRSSGMRIASPRWVRSEPAWPWGAGIGDDSTLKPIADRVRVNAG